MQHKTRSSLCLSLLLVGALAANSQAQAGSYSTFGAGCNDVSFTNRGVPRVGKTHQLVLGAKVTSNRHPVGVLNFGLSNTSYLNVPLPVDLTPLGGAGCSIYISTEISVSPIPTSQAVTTVDVPVVNNRALVGLVYYNQFIFLSPQEPGLRFSFSNGGKGTIGS